MPKLSHSGLIALSGMIWLSIGLFLMPVGLRLLYSIIGGAVPLADTPLVSFMSPYTGGAENAAVVLIALGLMIGSLKVKYVLSKTIQKVIGRILGFVSPTSVSNIYGIKYLYLVAFMMSLGFAIKYFNVPADIRGFIDVAVGSALTTGGLTFLRVAYEYRCRKPAK